MIIFESMKEQAWKSAIHAMISPGMCLTEEECMQYSIAEIYTGPRPAYVPKAETIGMVSCTVMQSYTSPTPLSLVADVSSETLCVSHEGFVGETLEELPSIAPPLSLKEEFLETGDAAVVVSNGCIYEEAGDVLGVDSKGQDSIEVRDAASVDLHSSVATASLHHRTSLSADATLHSSDARGVSMEEVFSSIPFDKSEETLPFSEQEYRFSSPQSELFGHLSSSSRSSTNSFSQELPDEVSPERSPPKVQPRKKGACFLCLKVNKMHRKETCLVCSKKYCSSCVIKAMGSMPEGRKCCGCVGQPICEARRHELGKPTKLLGRLFCNLEVQQIMKAERDCSANQLRPEQLYVNERPLTGKEFGELLGCKFPPSKLQPGRYWYDPVCGYWGKVGEKPEKIISVNLNIGGVLLEDASAGSTGVYINNREITKVELRMLKLAGVQCPPQTRLWVEADGSYQEEGHNHCRGNIWEKAPAKVYGLLCGLPMPNTATGAIEPSKVVPAYYEPNTTYKILLLGPAGSGTSTIIKQAKLLYDVKFTPKELQHIKALIQKNIYNYLITLLEARDRFEDEENAARKEVAENTPSTSSGDFGQELQSPKPSVFTLPARLKDQADWFLQTEASGDLEKYCPALTREHASLIEDFWKDPAIQATYRRKAELHTLPDVAGHFLDKVVSISSNDYSPDDRDILYAEGMTHDFGLAEVQFFMEDESRQASGPYAESFQQSLSEARYHLIRISGNGITDGCKLFKMFDDVAAIIFCVALDSYDQMCSDGKEPLHNKMLSSRNLLASILKYPPFRDKPVVVFLNKYDSFEEKILEVPLTTCEWFSDFDPVKSSTLTRPQLAQQAYTYIAHMFKKQFEMVNPTGRKLITVNLKALDRTSVGEALHYVKEILVWEESRKRVLRSTSFYTTETSSVVTEPLRR